MLSSIADTYTLTVECAAQAEKRRANNKVAVSNRLALEAEALEHKRLDLRYDTIMIPVAFSNWKSQESTRERLIRTHRNRDRDSDRDRERD